MTFASRITLTRMLLVPVFSIFAIRYGLSVAEGQPQEKWRWTAIALFIAASASDGIDGWVARRFNQVSKFGAFIDPLADKLLLLCGIVFLSAFPWGGEEWSIPPWFAALVIARDCLIVGGIVIIRKSAGKVHYSPHWTGKVCTVTQMIVLGWVMLRIDLLPLSLPLAPASVFILWSALSYIHDGLRQIRRAPAPPS